MRPHVAQIRIPGGAVSEGGGLAGSRPVPGGGTGASCEADAGGGRSGGTLGMKLAFRANASWRRATDGGGGGELGGGTSGGGGFAFSVTSVAPPPGQAFSPRVAAVRRLPFPFPPPPCSFVVEPPFISLATLRVRPAFSMAIFSEAESGIEAVPLDRDVTLRVILN